jgi:hypothetical protein
MLMTEIRQMVFLRPLQASLCIVFATLLSGFVQVFYLRSEWIIISAFLIAIRPSGMLLRQVLPLLLLLACALMLGIGIAAINHGMKISALFGALILAGVFLIFQKERAQWVLLFCAGLLIAAFDVPDQLPNYLIDLLIGAAIGVLAQLLWLPARYSQLFKSGLKPLWRAFEDYTHAAASVLKQQSAVATLSTKKIALQSYLASSFTIYPEWVFHVGFNYGLRASFRFFLLRVEQLSELCFAMDFYLQQWQKLSQEMPDDEMVMALATALDHNAALLSIVANYFDGKLLTDHTGDYQTDIATLETAYHNHAPHDHEALLLSPLYLTFGQLLQQVKDMRQVLLQLLLAVGR